MPLILCCRDDGTKSQALKSQPLILVHEFKDELADGVSVIEKCKQGLPLHMGTQSIPFSDTLIYSV